MSEQLVKSFFRNLPFKIRREVAGAVHKAADRLRAIEDAAAPTGPTGRTKRSIRVRRTRNDLTFFVEAGGPTTTVPVRNGISVSYDYTLAREFGTRRQAAEPWFYPAYRANADEIEAQMRNDIGEIIAKA